MGLFDNEKEKQGAQYPGKQGEQQGIISTLRAYSPGKNVELTVVRGASGEPKAVFARDLLFGIF